MRFLIFFSCVAMVVISTAAILRSNDKASGAEVHLRKACEIVWSANTPGESRGTQNQVEWCVNRAMSAMGNENRLRDNELKRLLMSSERELDTCKEQLEKINEEPTEDCFMGCFGNERVIK